MTTVIADGDPRKGFRRVSKSHPCPVCKKADWCLIAHDGTAAICPRTEAGSAKHCGDAGWLHRLSEPPRQPAFRQPKPAKSHDWPAEAARFAAALTDAAATWLHHRLGLPEGTLASIPLLGSSGQSSAGVITTWPEVDAAGTVIGITERTPNETKDEKRMRAGGKRGLTLPVGWGDRSGPVFVVEGPTDAAAMTAADLSAVGRPSKDGGGNLLARLLDGWPVDRAIVIVGENDPPSGGEALPGRDAAVRVATRLAATLQRPVQWSLPPADAKDVRGWLTHPDRGSTPWPDRGADLSLKLLSTGAVVEPSDGAGSDDPNQPPPHYPEIIVGTDEHRVNAEAVAALASEPDIYQRGGMLVHVIEQGADSDPAEVVRRPAGAPAVRELVKPLLRERLTRVARWVEWRGKSDEPTKVPVHPPSWAVEAVQARGRWPGVSPLEAVVTHPVLLPDGTILTDNGYHRPTGILASLPPGLALTVPDAPTRADVSAAVEALFDPLMNFPFETAAHRAALVAGLLTPLAWFAFTGPAPLFLIDKNVRGAGAGLLADVIALTLTGRRFSVMTYTNDKEELRKRITTVAVEGERLILLDNLSGAVGNDILDAALTSEGWKDRLLGGNRMFDGPLHVTWFGTGNNVQLQADTSRRVCHVRMETADERPELRDDFKYRDLRAHVRANRGRLLSAALTILRGWIVAGRPTHGLKPWGSYEPWSDVVREAVVFAGLPDPGETRLALQTAADRDAGAMSAILDGLERMDTDRRGLTTADIITRLKETDRPPDWMADVRSAVEDLCGKLDGRALGLKFRHFKRRNFNGKMLDRAGEDRMNGNRWAVIPAARVRPIPSPAPPAPQVSAAGGAGGAGDAPGPLESAPEQSPAKRRFSANPNRGLAGLDGEGGGR